MRARAYAPAVLLFGALLAVFVWRHHHCLYDDAFIYLRYVRNVHAGCGIRWNCDDPPVEAFSSPLYFALLLIGSLFSTKLVLVSTVVSTAALAATGALAIVAGGRSVPKASFGWVAAATIAFVLAADHLVLLNAVIGMDAGLGALFVLAVLVALDRRRYAVAGGLAVAATLARPEALALACVVPFFVPRDDKRRVAAIALGGVALVTLVRFAVFHDIAPNTYWAKSGGTWGHARLGAEYILLFVEDFPVVLLAPLALLDRTMRERRTALALLAGAALWCAMFLRTGGDTFAYSRLAFPLVPALAVLALRGCFAVGQRLRRPWLAVGPLLVVGVAAAVRHHIPEQHGFANVTAWTAVGRYLEKQFPGKTVATVPIGAIGYTSKLHVLDLVGLADRTIAKAGRTVPPELLTRDFIGHERHDLASVVARAPDLVVTTKFRDRPWRSLDEVTAGFYADWLLLRAIKEGRLHYHVVDAPIARGVHWLLLERDTDRTGEETIEK